jgi:hypothetical protein
LGRVQIADEVLAAEVGLWLAEIRVLKHEEGEDEGESSVDVGDGAPDDLHKYLIFPE